MVAVDVTVDVVGNTVAVVDGRGDARRASARDVVAQQQNRHRRGRARVRGVNPRLDRTRGRARLGERHNAGVDALVQTELRDAVRPGGVDGIVRADDDVLVVRIPRVGNAELRLRKRSIVHEVRGQHRLPVPAPQPVLAENPVPALEGHAHLDVGIRDELSRHRVVLERRYAQHYRIDTAHARQFGKRNRTLGEVGVHRIDGLVLDVDRRRVVSVQRDLSSGKNVYAVKHLALHGENLESRDGAVRNGHKPPETGQVRCALVVRQHDAGNRDLLEDRAINIDIIDAHLVKFEGDVDVGVVHHWHGKSGLPTILLEEKRAGR